MLRDTRMVYPFKMKRFSILRIFTAIIQMAYTTDRINDIIRAGKVFSEKLIWLRFIV